MAAALPHPESRRSDQAASTRQRLLEAAYQLLVDEGYQSATVQSIARRANLTTGAIYANFANKHELLVLAALDRWYASGLIGTLDTPADTGELMDVMVRHLASPAAPEHRLLTEVTGASLRDRSAEHLLREGAEQIAEAARRTIDDAKDAGIVRRDLPTDGWVALSVNLFLGAITSKAFDLPQPDAGEIRELLTSFIWPWLADRPTE